MTQVAMRAAAVAFLNDYATSASLKLQVYPGRPRTLYPPTGFVDALRERIEWPGMTLMQRTTSVEVIVVHGLFDSKDAADQKDAFVDGFVAWARTRYHQAGASTLIAPVSIEDLPAYVNDWVPPAEQRTYYATQITLEGYAET